MAPDSIASAPDDLLDRAERRPLRFLALWADGALLRWQAECIRKLVASGVAELAGAIAAPVPAGLRQGGPLDRLYSAMVRRSCRALDHVDASTVDLRASRSAASEDIDFILSFVPELPAAGAIAPRLGVWHFAFGEQVPGQLPGFRETAHGRRTVSIRLEAGIAGEERVLHRATVKTRRTHHRTLDALLAEAAAVCLGACRRARSGSMGETAPQQEALAGATPLRALLAQVDRCIRGALGRVAFHDVWSVGIVAMPIEAMLDGAPMPAPQWLAPPLDGRFHADPFPVVVGGRLHVLFEMYDAAQRRGWIAACEADRPDTGAAPTALDLGCHMSYPATFRFRGGVYLAPEVAAIGGLRIFRMGATPWEWAPISHELKDLPLVDPTLFEDAGRWWLFATLEGPASDTDLHAWHAASPFGPWTPHALNPIKSDVRSARPAGAVFQAAGSLYRPGQDCAAGYGAAVTINRIVRLTGDSFEEVPVRRIGPARTWPWHDGMHTFNVYGGLIVMDAKRRELGPSGRRWWRAQTRVKSE